MNKRKRLKTTAGFTLVEVMVVTAVIGMLTAISIPNLLKVRQNSNDKAILNDIRTFSSSVESFRSMSPTYQYPAAMAGLTTITPPYLDDSWTDGVTRKGHVLTYLSDTNNYSLSAIAVPGEAVTSYCVDQSGVIFTGATAQTTGCSGGSALT